MKNINQEELNKILKEHKLWLKGEGGKRADLENTNLKDVYLKNANLQYANLKDANLEMVNLRGSNLRYANLRNANLQYTNLAEVNLEDANLSYANLEDANLRCANLKNSDLKQELDAVLETFNAYNSVEVEETDKDYEKVSNLEKKVQLKANKFENP